MPPTRFWGISGAFEAYRLRADLLADFTLASVTCNQLWGRRTEACAPPLFATSRTSLTIFGEHPLIGALFPGWTSDDFYFPPTKFDASFLQKKISHSFSLQTQVVATVAENWNETWTKRPDRGPLGKRAEFEVIQSRTVGPTPKPESWWRQC